MKKIYLAIFGLLLLLILAGLIFFYEDDLNKNYNCVKRKEFITEEWEGVITKKYVDSTNHNAETFELLENPNAMFRDGTDFFKFIEIGDSVVKKHNTDTIKVYRKGQKYGFKIYFGCE